MVVKKRCDFCLKIKENNFQSTDKVLNRELIDVLTAVAGIDVPAEKLVSLRTCFDCAIGLLQAEPVVVKTRALLGRLSKQRRKRKHSGAASGDVNASQLTLDDTDLQATEEKSITAKGKSKAIAKKLVDSIINDELDENPVASSTLAVNTSTTADKSMVKKTPKKTTKGNATPKNAESPSKQAKMKIFKELDEDSEEEIKKPVEQKSRNAKSLESPNSSRTGNQLAPISTPKKDGSTASPKKTVKRSFSFDKDSHGDASEIVLFKKMKDTTAASNTNSQESTNGKGAMECLECGKTFLHAERYEAHVASQKCKLAAYNCKHPDCMRRFFKLPKMLEHMQKKHPEMAEAEMD